MATTVRIDEADLPQLVERARAGEDILLAEGETPVARLVLLDRAATPPVVAAPSPRGLSAAELFAEGATPKRPDLFGLYAGVASIGPEFFDPLPEEELRLWEGGNAEEDPGPPAR